MQAGPGVNEEQLHCGGDDLHGEELLHQLPPPPCHRDQGQAGQEQLHCGGEDLQ